MVLKTLETRLFIVHSLISRELRHNIFQTQYPIVNMDPNWFSSFSHFQ